MAADRGVRVYTVGVGTKGGEIIGAEGWSMRVRLDEDALHGIADLTRGEYFYAGDARRPAEDLPGPQHQALLRAEGDRDHRAVRRRRGDARAGVGACRCSGSGACDPRAIGRGRRRGAPAARPRLVWSPRARRAGCRRRRGRAGRRRRLRGAVTQAAAAHPAGHRRRGAAHAGEQRAAVACGQGLRGGAAQRRARPRLRLPEGRRRAVARFEGGGPERQDGKGQRCQGPRRQGNGSADGRTAGAGRTARTKATTAATKAWAAASSSSTTA